MPHNFHLITFDVYTALFDVEGSLVPPLQQALGGQAEALPLARTWRTKQLEYALISNSLGRGRVSFWLATRRALDYALGRAKANLSEAARTGLMEVWRHLQPWPEADHVLHIVKSGGWQLGALSNGDEAMLRAGLANTLTTPFDHIFASDQAGHYKPHPSVYALPLTALGLKADQVLHVAGSATDVMGARSAGLPCAWSNRHGDRVLDPASKPDYEFENLLGVLAIL